MAALLRKRRTVPSIRCGARGRLPGTGCYICSASGSSLPWADGHSFYTAAPAPAASQGDAACPGACHHSHQHVLPRPGVVHPFGLWCHQYHSTLPPQFNMSSPARAPWLLPRCSCRFPCSVPRGLCRGAGHVASHRSARAAVAGQARQDADSQTEGLARFGEEGAAGGRRCRWYHTGVCRLHSALSLAASSGSNCTSCLPSAGCRRLLGTGGV